MKAISYTTKTTNKKGGRLHMNNKKIIIKSLDEQIKEAEEIKKLQKKSAIKTNNDDENIRIITR